MKESKGKPLPDKGYTIDKMSVGHNSAEMYIHLEQTVIMMVPSIAKRMTIELREELIKYEEEFGTIRPKQSPRKESLPRKIIKEFYKSRQVSSKIVSINTKKRK